MPVSPAIFRRSIMTIEDEQRTLCAYSLANGCTTTSAFRTRKANEYPDDQRNARAAETLKLLAKNAAELPDESWRLLQMYYNPDSKSWQDAVSLATKEVGFSNKSKSLAYLIQRLIRLLSQSASVAS
jgi:hypothetical protein